MTATEIVAGLACGARCCSPAVRAGRGLVHCPAHDDGNPSLNIGEGPDGTVLLRCHAGCSQEAVIAALRERGLWPERNGNAPTAAARSGPTRQITATYGYHNAHGDLLFEVIRFAPKAFAQRRPDGHGGWLWGLNGIEPVLYQWPLLELRPDEPVFVVEGEKDADTLTRLDFVATCNPMGAGKWRPSFSQVLRGRRVAILPDNDDPGRKHARTVAESLAAADCTVKVVNLPDLPEHGDVSDWLSQGHTRDDLAELVKNTPEWQQTHEAPGTLVSEVQPEKVDWLWPSRLALGKVTLLDGDPGTGKSALALDLAARITRGMAWPDGAPGSHPAGVVLLTAEDGLADTVRPRLDAAGGDPGKVLALDLVGEDQHQVMLPGDLPAVEAAVRRVGAALIIIDPLMAFLGGQVNAHRDQDVRRALRPLAEMAERLHVAVMVIRHLNKNPGGPAIYRGGGSIGIIGAARIALLVGADPDDDQRRILACVKNNLAPISPSLAYQLTTAANGSVQVAWKGVSSVTAAQLVAQPDSEEEATALNAAEEFLLALLAAGPAASKDVQRQARDVGIAERTLWRAKSRLGVKALKTGMDGGWHWALTDAEGCHTVAELAEFEGCQSATKAANPRTWQTSGVHGSLRGEPPGDGPLNPIQPPTQAPVEPVQLELGEPPPPADLPSPDEPPESGAWRALS